MFPKVYICEDFMGPIIIAESLVLTQYSNKKDARRAAYLYHKWVN